MPDMDDMFDFTDHLQNTFTDDRNIAISPASRSVIGHVSHYDADVYIGSPYEINGAKFYVQNPVGYTSATQHCETAYWDKRGNAGRFENTDDTKTDTNTLTKTGSVTFSSDTTALVQPALIFGRMLYWYRFRFNNVPTSGTNRPVLYFVTIHAPMQPFTNIWDGTPTPLFAAWKKPSVEKYIDNTTSGIAGNVDGLRQRTGDGWVNNPDLTMKLSGFATNDYVLLGSFVRLAGFQTTMPKDDRNKKSSDYTCRLF